MNNSNNNINRNNNKKSFITKNNMEFSLRKYTTSDFQLMKDSAEEGDVVAQYALGDIYLQGRGVTPNITEAKKWLLMAANKGYLLAQYQLSYCLYYITEEYAEAYKWAKCAADQFDIESIALLSTMYFRGHGVVQNDKAAFSNAEYAALRGDSIAQNNLAYFYYLGLVVGKDELMAFALWSLSVQAGNKQATTNYMMAKDNLNHIQIKAAKKIQKTVISQIKENKKDK
jgi:TPR repeat protein